MRNGVEFKSFGFVMVEGAHCLQGSYPSQLLQKWDDYDERKSKFSTLTYLG